MAKKKRKKKEEFTFQVPDFDEAQFMRKEVVGAKAAVVTLLLAFGVGAASYLLTLGGLAYVAPLVAFGALYSTRYLFPMMGLDMSLFDRRTWLGNGAVFFFSWLAFWVLLLNPPFLDISPPVVHVIQIPGATPNQNLTAGGQAILILNGSTDFTVRVQASDNIRVAQVTVGVQVDGAVVDTIGLTPPEEDGWWSGTVNAVPDEVYVLQIVALDHRGLQTGPLDVTVVTS